MGLCVFSPVLKTETLGPIIFLLPWPPHKWVQQWFWRFWPLFVPQYWHSRPHKNCCSPGIIGYSFHYLRKRKLANWSLVRRFGQWRLRVPPWHGTQLLRPLLRGRQINAHIALITIVLPSTILLFRIWVKRSSLARWGQLHIFHSSLDCCRRNMILLFLRIWQPPLMAQTDSHLILLRCSPSGIRLSVQTSSMTLVPLWIRRMWVGGVHTRSWSGNRQRRLDAGGQTAQLDRQCLRTIAEDGLC